MRKRSNIDQSIKTTDQQSCTSCISSCWPMTHCITERQLLYLLLRSFIAHRTALTTCLIFQSIFSFQWILTIKLRPPVAADGWYVSELDTVQTNSSLCLTSNWIWKFFFNLTFKLSALEETCYLGCTFINSEGTLYNSGATNIVHSAKSVPPWIGQQLCLPLIQKWSQRFWLCLNSKAAGLLPRWPNSELSTH